MVRQIIKIDEELCNGCGLCVNACHEGAIGLVDGKAKLLREDYCDGLGNCLPVCPAGAISFETREAAEFNEEAANKNMKKHEVNEEHHIHSGCPGSRMMKFSKDNIRNEAVKDISENENTRTESMLSQWPVQIKLVPYNAPYFDGADLLVAADCTAYAYGNFHSFMKNKITLIGCPKLDDTDYSEKLSQILRYNNIRSITVIRMEVPCCGGIAQAVKTAILNSGKLVPWRIVIISTDGMILEDTK